jgi:Lrp/AsnC family transcriptional regulator, leucine-responsive regulatory protein
MAKAGWIVRAIIRMSCYGPRCVLRDAAVRDWPEVQEIHRITGDACCVLKVAAASMDAFEEVIDRLAPCGQPSSTMVLSTPLDWRPVTSVGARGAG